MSSITGRLLHVDGETWDIDATDDVAELTGRLATEFRMPFVLHDSNRNLAWRGIVADYSGDLFVHYIGGVVATKPAENIQVIVSHYQSEEKRRLVIDLAVSLADLSRQVLEVFPPDLVKRPIAIYGCDTRTLDYITGAGREPLDNDPRVQDFLQRAKAANAVEDLLVLYVHNEPVPGVHMTPKAGPAPQHKDKPVEQQDKPANATSVYAELESSSNSRACKLRDERCVFCGYEHNLAVAHLIENNELDQFKHDDDEGKRKQQWLRGFSLLDINDTHNLIALCDACYVQFGNNDDFYSIGIDPDSLRLVVGYRARNWKSNVREGGERLPFEKLHGRLVTLNPSFPLPSEKMLRHRWQKFLSEQVIKKRVRGELVTTHCFYCKNCTAVFESELEQQQHRCGPAYKEELHHHVPCLGSFFRLFSQSRSSGRPLSELVEELVRKELVQRGAKSLHRNSQQAV